VDRLKLHVGQGGSNKHRQGMRNVPAAMDELLQLCHAVLKVARRRHHEVRIARSGAADPVLAASELPRQPIGAATSGQPLAVDFAKQMGGEGEGIVQSR
jgi:hypothetical protein